MKELAEMHCHKPIFVLVGNKFDKDALGMRAVCRKDAEEFV